jgi:hypothetical protein
VNVPKISEQIQNHCFCIHSKRRAEISLLVGFYLFHQYRSHESFREVVIGQKNIILETPFNNEGFKNLIDLTKNSVYQSSLIVGFLKSSTHSLERVAARRNF